MSRSRIDEGPRVLVFSLCFVLSLSLSGCFTKERVILDKPVLVINGRKVSTKEFSERLALRLRTYDALTAKDEANLERAKSETVKAFILDTIARDYANKNKISVSNAETEVEATRFRSNYPDEFAFRRALAEENIAYDDWKKDLELTLLQKKILALITAKISEPSEKEMQEYYDSHKALWNTPARVRLRQVVLAKEDDARRIEEQLQKGESIAKLAKTFSVAPEGSNGGDTGWLPKGTLDVFDTAFKMKVGQRSKVLKSAYGYHIFEVLKKEPEGRLNFADAKAKIRAALKETREQVAFSSWLEEQVRKSDVKRDDALIQAIKVTTRGS
jgi:parvulin-like peptidyl-prolyl isomerase